MSEQVLVFPANRLPEYLKFFTDGFCCDPFIVEDILNDVLDPSVAFYMDRAEAEVDPEYKQIIPYSLLMRQHPMTPLYFCYQRTKKGGESRLHDRWSVGVGGHINPCDGDGPAGYEAAFRRELLEEVSVELPPGSEHPLAVIYDPVNAVGAVHFGVVHRVVLPGNSVLSSTDPSLANGLFLTVDNLKARQLEDWSMKVVNNLHLLGR